MRIGLPSILSVAFLLCFSAVQAASWHTGTCMYSSASGAGMTWNSNGVCTYVVAANVTSVNVLLVGGGAAGGADFTGGAAGGGGGGGCIYMPNLVVGSTNITVNIGAGGVSVNGFSF